MASKRSYYEVLGVDKSASADEIKKAFRKLAQKHHPDAGGDENTFKEINEAYEVLSDPKKKAQYDRFGQYGGWEQAAGAGGGNPFAGFGGFGGAAANVDWGDLFQNLRNGEGAFGGNWDFKINRNVKGQDLKAHIDLTFDEAFNGVAKKITIHIPSNGKTQEVTAKIPQGAVDGGKLRFKEKGEYGSGGGKRGDLIVVTHILPDALYSRDKADVLCDLPVSIDEAALGTTVVVPAPDGSLVKIKVPAGTEHGKVMRVRGKGAKKIKGNGYGDLKVCIKVVVPKRLNIAQKQALEAFAKASQDSAKANQDLESSREALNKKIDEIKAKSKN